MLTSFSVLLEKNQTNKYFFIEFLQKQTMRVCPFLSLNLAYKHSRDRRNINWPHQIPFSRSSYMTPHWLQIEINSPIVCIHGYCDQWSELKSSLYGNLEYQDNSRDTFLAFIFPETLHRLCGSYAKISWDTVIYHVSLTLMLLVANSFRYKTMANGYLSESTQQEPFNEYQHDRV